MKERPFATAALFVCGAWRAQARAVTVFGE